MPRVPPHLTSATTPRRRPAAWPSPLEPLTLVGTLVRLEPIGADITPAFTDELVRAANDQAVWRFLVSDGRTPQAAHAYFADLIAQWSAGTALPFAVRLTLPGHSATGRVVGVTRLKDVERAHRRVGIGSWFVPEVWSLGVNTEAKALLLAHAFDGLGALRVEFDTDARNARSRAALAALGAVEEGLLRAHRITRDGERRDSVVFSVIAEEWPETRRRIGERMAAQLARRPGQADGAITLHTVREGGVDERGD